MITPNSLTLLRVLLAIVIWCVLANSRAVGFHLTGFFLFLLASLTDLWDGILARHQSAVSDFGKIADPIADKILILTTLFAMSHLRLFSAWWLAPIFIREVGISIVRLFYLKKKIVIPAESAGKMKMGVQFATVVIGFTVLLASGYGVRAGWFNVLNLFLQFMLFVSNLMAIMSGVMFLKKLSTTR